jgi:hypothetical protein
MLGSPTADGPETTFLSHEELRRLSIPSGRIRHEAEDASEGTV